MDGADSWASCTISEVSPPNADSIFESDDINNRVEVLVEIRDLLAPSRRARIIEHR